MVALSEDCARSIWICDSISPKGPTRTLCQGDQYLDWSQLGNDCIFLPSVSDEVDVISALRLLSSGCSVPHPVAPAESSQGSISIKLAPRFVTT